MNIQLCGFTEDDTSNICNGLYNAGKLSSMSGMDDARNMVGSSIAAADPQ